MSAAGSAPARPRLGPTLAVLAGAIPLHLALSALLVGAGLFLRYGTDVPEGEELQAALKELLLSPRGLLLALLPVQLAFLALSLGAAAASPVPWRRRLGLVRPRLAPDLVLALVLATPLFLLASGLLLLLLGLGESAQTDLIRELLTRPEGAAFLLMVGIVTVGAGVVEELLFRGYVQTRLTQRWPTPLAILVPGLVFAAMHMDPTHAVAVFPLGLWFGFLAWLTGSVLPAIGAHLLNNALQVLMINAFGASEVELGLAYVALFALAAACGGYALLRLFQHHARGATLPPTR